MASAIAAARQQINDVGADGDLDGARAARRDRPRRRLDRRPDRAARRQAIYPPKLHGEPIDRSPARCWTCSSRAGRGSCGWSARPARARARSPARSPTGCGRGAAGAIETRHGEPFYGYAEMSGGPSSDEFTFRYEYVPDKRPPRRRPADPRRLRGGDGARLGGDDRRGQHDPRRRAAVAQRHARRPPLALPARGGPHRRPPAPGFAVLIAYNPGPRRAPATSPTPGTRASRPPSRSPATGRRWSSSAPAKSS